MSSSSTDARPDAAHDPAHPRRETKRSARDRWLLFALLLLALCIGIGLGAGLSSHLASVHAAAAPATDCGAQRAHADAIATAGATPSRPEHPPSAAATATENTRANDSASNLLSPGPLRAVMTKPAPKARTVSTAERLDAGAPASTLGPDLREALRLLRAAQRALRAAEGTRALSLLDQMARRTPDALVEEREVTRVLAHCADSDVDNARLAAAALRAAGGASVYAHRLSKSCVGPAPAPARLLDEMRQRAHN